MRLARLGLGIVNSTVGAVRSNAAQLLAQARALHEEGVQLAAFPELVLCGYPPEDLALFPGFVSAQWQALAGILRATASWPSVFVLGVLASVDSEVYNCAALVHRGQLLGLVPKEKLPLYSVFYEARCLSPGRAGLMRSVDLSTHGLPAAVPFGDLLFQADFGVVAVEVCEDIWSPIGPMHRRCFQGAELVVNLSASPFRIGVEASRRELVCTRAADYQATVLYANAVGSNDGLVFDGGGFVAQNGRLVFSAPRFVAGAFACTVDLDRTRRLRTENTTFRADTAAFQSALAPRERAGRVVLSQPTTPQRSPVFSVPEGGNFFLPQSRPMHSPRQAFCEELLDAMALGIGDYFEKSTVFRHIGVALSGGRDSLLCLLLAQRYVLRRQRALGADPSGDAAAVASLLRAFYMPTRFSSQATRNAAEVTAAELSVPLVVLSIDEAFEREAEAAQKMLQPGESLTPLTLQNIQSRLRGERMWNWANAVSGMFLQTGNMSEKAVGYTTIGGDLMGCLAPIANLPKTVVNYLLDYLLETQKLDGIARTIAIPASAELAPNQEDERDLMPYPVLDAHIALQVGEKYLPEEAAQITAVMFPAYTESTHGTWAERFANLFTRSIYKWVQAPLSLHLGNLDIERERAFQHPVITQPEWRKREP
ncbi:MAG: NAD(+) synthase [Myxococcales bacterium]|nr:NAD(+) synthase [Myxococcales bacterium]